MAYYQIDVLNDESVRQLFGLNREQVAALAFKALPRLMERRLQEFNAKPDRRRAPEGGRRRKLTPFRELMLALIYLGQNASHEMCGRYFRVSTDVSEDTFAEVIQTLKKVCPSDRWNADNAGAKANPHGLPPH